MKWESINLHLENLFPGLVSLFLLMRLLPAWIVLPFSQNSFRTNELFDSGVLLAASYLLGAVAVAVSRLLVDRVSEKLPRPLLLSLLSRGPLKGMSFKHINDNYRDKLRHALSSGNDLVKQEVARRRERGRLVRTALIPAILAVVLVTSSSSAIAVVLWALLAFVVLLFIYAYVETTIYEECLLV